MTTIGKLNLKIIFHFMGLLLVVNGAFVLVSAIVGVFYNDADTLQLSLSGIVLLTIGGLLMIITRRYQKEIRKKEGYIIVTFGWIIMALGGTLPYLFTGSITNFPDAFFETMSGYTTTGATILDQVESLSHGVLLWRSLTHWIGGMGIIVLTIAILPLLGIGGMQLFAAEAPGPGGDKLHPRIADTAKRLWIIYVGYTAMETLMLKIAGMDFFSALNHSLSTLSTGGFSTKNEGVAFWNDQPVIQYIIMAFMFLAGANFILSYFAFKRRFQKVLRDEEFILYSILVVLFSLIVSLLIYFDVDLALSEVAHPMVWGELESAFRHGTFQVLAILTTTGFTTADYTVWLPFLTIIFFGLMFLGGSSGSTAGGVKIVRHLIMIKNGIMEFKRTLHPNAILPVRYNKKAVSQPIVFNILGFFILYMLSFIIGALVFSWLGLDYRTALGGAASTLGNIGPALGELGPTFNYSSLPTAAKWWSTFLMLLGRLELFTVLILLTPFFWRNR